MRPPITSEKHIVQYPRDVILQGTAQSIDLVTASNAGTSADIVPIGSLIKAIYVELWLIADGNQDGSQIVILEKLQNGSQGPGFALMALLNEYNNKRNIFYTTEGLLGSDNANPTPVLRMWIKIPKGKQRMAQGDSIKLTISSQATPVARCGMTIFKSYT